MDRYNGNNMPNGSNDENKVRKSRRDVDLLVESVDSWWVKTVVFIRKTRVKTWKGVFVLAFVAGTTATFVWTASLKMQRESSAAGESSILTLWSADTSVVEGDTFVVDIVLNTFSSDVVVAKAVVNYNPQDFSLQSWDTANSSFVAGNTCVYNGKSCEIVDNDVANGKITITVAKPSPGVNSSTASVASLAFTALRAVAPTADNITLSYTAGSYADSDVILDNSVANDILTSVANLRMTVTLPVCTSFTYAEWGACQPDGTQSRGIVSQLPAGCDGGDYVTLQDCVYVPPVCTDYTYSTWGECQPNSTQSRTATGVPVGCGGGTTPVLGQSCTFVPSPCASFTYDAWSTCQPDGTQSRTYSSSSPAGCVGGETPILTQNCTYRAGPEPCAGFTYSDWGACQSMGAQSRTVSLTTPADCSGGVDPVLSQSCTYTPPTCTDFTYSDWSACQPGGTQSRTTVASLPGGCTGGAPVLSQTCSYVVASSNSDKDKDKKDDKKKKKKKKKSSSSKVASGDKIAPKIINLPYFMTKNRGDKVWWSATDNSSGIKSYKYKFNGKTVTTTSASLNIPSNVSGGVYFVTITAYDKAGNSVSRLVTIRVR